MLSGDLYVILVRARNTFDCHQRDAQGMRAGVFSTPTSAAASCLH